jgi:hypothetical protein
MTANARRPVQVGRHRLVFLKSTRVGELPTRWHETSKGRFKVSTPELTALDLVARQQSAGGIARVVELLQALAPDMTAAGLSTALHASLEIPTAQRLGALLSRMGHSQLSNGVADWLATRRTRRIPLTPEADAQAATALDSRFKVHMPATLQAANT